MKAYGERVCVCVRERERERECVCERERKRECVCMCVCERERERGLTSSDFFQVFKIFGLASSCSNTIICVKKLILKFTPLPPTQVSCTG